MEEFILAGLLFHVGAAAFLCLVSALSGLVEMRRRKTVTAVAAPSVAAPVINMTVSARTAQGPAIDVESHSRAA